MEIDQCLLGVLPKATVSAAFEETKQLQLLLQGKHIRAFIPQPELACKNGLCIDSNWQGRPQDE